MSNVQNGKVNLLQKLEVTPSAQLANLPEVADRFKHIYAVMNGNSDKAAVKYEAEKFHFMKLIQDNVSLQECTKLSLYGCFMDMAVNGLSFDPAMKHAYVFSFSTNVGTKQVPKWEKRATLMISGYGELTMRMRQGQIKHADNPILVYEGDHFSHGTKNGSVFLEHVATFPRVTDNIIASYIRLERPDGSVDYKVLSIEEVQKLRKFSKDPNSKAWTDGLPGMIQNKTIKHAFKSYPKIRMGEFSQLSSNMVDEDVEEVPKIDYGLNQDAAHAPAAAVVVPPTNATVQHSDVPDDAFVNQPKPAAATAQYDDDNF